MGRQTSRDPGMLLDELGRRAEASGVRSAVIAEARQVTGERFASGVAAREVRRVEAYFWGVVRRRTLRGAAPRLGDTLVLASLAEELRTSGFSAEAVHDELRRVYGGRIESRLIDAFLAGPQPVRAA